MLEARAFGDWESPITAEIIVNQTRSFSDLTVDGGKLCWIERRPDENRAVLVDQEGTIYSDQPQGLGSRLYEYGWGPYAIHDGVACWVNRADQRIYRRNRDGSIVALTEQGSTRYGCLAIDARFARVIAVAERWDGPGEPRHSIVAIPFDGGEIVTLREGRDFYNAPTPSPDGSRIVWVEWDHPYMPHEASEIHVGEINAAGRLTNTRHVAGKPGSAAIRPTWAPDGYLYFSHESGDWFNLHVFDGETVQQLVREPAEHVYGSAFDVSDRYVLYVARSPQSRVKRLDRRTGAIETLLPEFTSVGSVCILPDGIAVAAGSARVPMSLWRLLDGETAPALLRSAGGPVLKEEYLAEPVQITVPTTDGATTYAYFFAPQSPDYRPVNEADRPPLIVNVHGGPTGPASTALIFGPGALYSCHAYWTSRGYAVVDLDYRGSTGHGKAYRESLNGHWGEYDVTDAASVVKHLGDLGLIDPNRSAIRGASAGGFTVLAAVSTSHAFACGVAMFPVADLKSFRSETHKLESHYLDTLVGNGSTDEEMSPINHADGVRAPLLFLQGGEDRICLPAQAKRMVEAVRANGRTAEYIEFDGEGHGFVRGETILRALDAEERFYRQHLIPRPARSQTQKP